MLAHLMMIAEPRVFGVLALLNKRCADLAHDLNRDKQRQWLEAVPATGVKIAWMNYRFRHSGKWHGEYRGCNSVRTKYYLRHYVNGQRWGSQITIMPHIGRAKISQYAGDKKNGIAKLYELDANKDIGRLLATYMYKDGVIDGLCREWWERHGGLKQEFTKHDGSFVGAFRRWYWNGKLMQVEYYDRGLSNGIGLHWRSNGKLISKWFYIDAHFDGWYETWFDNGRRHQRIHFNMNQRDGDAYLWNEQGTLIRHSQYSMDRLNGLQRLWNDRGVLIMKANYLDGAFHGKYETWFDNGRRKLRVYYTYGLRHGRLTKWSGDGRIIRQADYRYGKKI